MQPSGSPPAVSGPNHPSSGQAPMSAPHESAARCVARHAAPSASARATPSSPALLPTTRPRCTN
eukprot:scaffold65441_cov31-Tisochrysis_lutea.AAC.2